MKLPPVHARPSALPPGSLHAVVRIVLLYASFASLWILLSDRAVGLLFHDPDSIQAVGTVKGLLFVAVTSVLLFYLVLRLAARQNGNGAAAAKVGAGGTLPASRRKLFAAIALLSLIFALLGSGAILQSAQRHHQIASAHLASIAQLKATQIEAWLEERRRDAEIVRTSPLFNEVLPRWRQYGDAAACARLLARMENFRTVMRYSSIALYDENGAVLLETGEGGHGTSAILRATVRQALAANAILMTDVFRMDEPTPAHGHLDFVAPLSATAAIVLRVDLDASLYLFLQTWPVPSDTAETVLFRHEADAVVPINPLRHAPEAMLTLRTPLTQTGVLAVQALAPGYRPGSLLEGVDYRGVPSLGVAQPVAGTPWWLVAKIDRAEIFHEAEVDAFWIVFSSFLVWFVALTLAVLFYKQRELQHARQQREEQAERLRALQLLDAIAGSSTDAIFAKDMQGRYLLFNNEAARVTGKTAAQALGHDDHVLFPPEQAELIMANDRQVMTAGRTATFDESVDTTDGAVVFHSTKGPLRDAEGRIIGLYGISRDVTRWKIAENALRASEQRLQMAQEGGEIGIWEWEPESDRLFLSPILERIYGMAPGSVTHYADWCAYVHPDDLQRIEQNMADIKSGKPFEIEFRIRRQAGEIRWLVSKGRAYRDDSGAVVSLSGINFDITARKQAEAMLQQQTEELAARNAELERFNSAMVGRELDMIALKRLINDLAGELGRAPPYPALPHDDRADGAS